MTLQLSAAALKANRKQKHKIPSEGSKLRALYDLFYAYKGLCISDYALRCLYHRNISIAIIQLRDFYGLDIRSWPMRKRGLLTPGEKCGPNKRTYAMVGAYVGNKYEDYTKKPRLK